MPWRPITCVNKIQSKRKNPVEPWWAKQQPSLWPSCVVLFQSCVQPGWKPREHEKTNILHTAKAKAQISFSIFVFAAQIVQFLFFLNPKFQASSHLLCLYSLIWVGPVPKPHCWFSHDVAHILFSEHYIPGI